MHVFLGTSAKDRPGHDLTIDCLWCKREQIHAHSWQKDEWLTLFHLIPLFPFHTVFVRCDSCHQDMIAKCSLTDLAHANPLTLKHLLAKRVSLIGRVCVILGLILCWAFWIGLIPAIIGFFYGRKYGGWMKKWGLVGLILNLFSPLIFVALVVVWQSLSKQAK